jgi:ribose 5-phosphate isomerase RpiB
MQLKVKVDFEQLFAEGNGIVNTANKTPKVRAAICG